MLRSSKGAEFGGWSMGVVNSVQHLPNMSWWVTSIQILPHGQGVMVHRICLMGREL